MGLNWLNRLTCASNSNKRQREGGDLNNLDEGNTSVAAHTFSDVEGARPGGHSVEFMQPERRAIRGVHVELVRPCWTGEQRWVLNMKMDYMEGLQGQEQFELGGAPYTKLGATPLVNVCAAQLYAFACANHEGMPYTGEKLTEEEMEGIGDALVTSVDSSTIPTNVPQMYSTDGHESTISVCKMEAPHPPMFHAGSDCFVRAVDQWRESLLAAGKCSAKPAYHEEAGEYMAWGLRGKASVHNYKMKATHVFQDDVMKAPAQMEESMMMEKGKRGAGVVAWVHENCDVNMATFGRVSASVC